MPSSIDDAILEKLALRPDGATAKQIGADMDRTAQFASQRLGRLFFAGLLDRRSSDPEQRKNEFVYTLKPKDTAKPLPRWTPSPTITPPRPLPKWAREYAALADELSEAELG